MVTSGIRKQYEAKRSTLKLFTHKVQRRKYSIMFPLQINHKNIY